LASANQIFIFEHGELAVYDGDHWLDVMKNGYSNKNSLHAAGRRSISGDDSSDQEAPIMSIAMKKRARWQGGYFPHSH
jgi:hypothetical protein